MDKDFRELGLSDNESKAYEMLVRFGTSPAVKVSKESGVPYAKVYSVLEKLVRKGLVRIVPGKTKRFVATDPGNLMGMLEEKRHALEKLEGKVKELRKFYTAKEKEPVTLVTGKGAFYKAVKELREPKRSVYRIKYTSEPKPEWMRNSRKWKRAGIDLKDIVRLDKETDRDVRKWLKVNKEIKKLPNEGVALRITDDEEVFISLIKSNITLLIRDRPLAKLMNMMFRETYKNAERIR